MQVKIVRGSNRKRAYFYAVNKPDIAYFNWDKWVAWTLTINKKIAGYWVGVNF